MEKSQVYLLMGCSFKCDRVLAAFSSKDKADKAKESLSEWAKDVPVIPDKLSTSEQRAVYHHKTDSFPYGSYKPDRLYAVRAMEVIA